MVEWHDVCRKTCESEIQADALIEPFLVIAKKGAQAALDRFCERGNFITTPVRLDYLKIVTAKDVPLTPPPYLEARYYAAVREA